ncbi:hypothetical protein PAXINDRAFT_20744 [Paxillus involutus ATCC 200175]|uniref:Uncharacterized protein n=1 Tax=Paxillus involutus ATCC 200175 TaxID=664439 RepID=A0A0C9SME6_PAXIN|nr:hypothetical protein PAXINDRAFT_20744 [Paxillus involutus ATCC 200175]
MSTQIIADKPFNVEKEAQKAAHEYLNKREEQGLERGGVVEQAAVKKAQDKAHEARAEKKKKGGPGITQPSLSPAEGRSNTMKR